VYDKSFFEVVYAYENYMAAKFLISISLDQAKRYQDPILEVSIDVYNDATLHINSPEDIPENDPVAKAIVGENGFWFHWD
jgi:hypothetical protein